MLWFFCRDETTTTVELRFEEEVGEFVLLLTVGENPTRMERYADSDAFAARVAALERQLEGERWQQDGPPLLLPSGWRTRHRPPQ